MPGSQSTKETCTGGGTCGSSYGAWACAERMAASRNVQFARANYIDGRKYPMAQNKTQIAGREVSVATEKRSCETYEAARKINPDGPSMFSEADVGEGVYADPTRVIIRARKSHM